MSAFMSLKGLETRSPPHTGLMTIIKKPYLNRQSKESILNNRSRFI
ncbi:hypothetical protein EV14_2543 [Prochlorococcus sp. MIT 0703]|nr:hypothetical protein EV14_2543 [Prochlorococcus sp. MIT 0703]